jgi:hypothetical protein
MALSHLFPLFLRYSIERHSIAALAHLTRWEYDRVNDFLLPIQREVRKVVTDGAIPVASAGKLYRFGRAFFTFAGKAHARL